MTDESERRVPRDLPQSDPFTMQRDAKKQLDEFGKFYDGAIPPDEEFRSVTRWDDLAQEEQRFLFRFREAVLEAAGVERLRLDLARSESTSRERKAYLDAVAAALHPHWSKDGRNAYCPDQLAGMVERLQSFNRDMTTKLEGEKGLSELLRKEVATGVLWLQKDRDEQKALVLELRDSLQSQFNLTEKHAATAAEQKARADRAAADAVQWMGKHAYADARCAALEKVVEAARRVRAYGFSANNHWSPSETELHDALEVLDSAQPAPDAIGYPDCGAAALMNYMEKNEGAWDACQFEGARDLYRARAKVVIDAMSAPDARDERTRDCDVLRSMLDERDKIIADIMAYVGIEATEPRDLPEIVRKTRDACNAKDERIRELEASMERAHDRVVDADGIVGRLQADRDNFERAASYEAGRAVVLEERIRALEEERLALIEAAGTCNPEEYTTEQICSYLRDRDERIRVACAELREILRYSPDGRISEIVRALEGKDNTSETTSRDGSTREDEPACVDGQPDAQRAVKESAGSVSPSCISSGNPDLALLCLIAAQFETTQPQMQPLSEKLNGDHKFAGLQYALGLVHRMRDYPGGQNGA